MTRRFEHVVSLLWQASEGSSEAELEQALGRGRARAFERLPALGNALELDQAMEALRAGVGHLPEDTSAAEWSPVISWPRLQGRSRQTDPFGL